MEPTPHPRALHILLAAALATLTAAPAACARRNAEPVSAFGEYRGYSQARYDGYRRSSAYLTLEDGTRLAYDLLLPTRDGRPADEPLPVLFTLTPYLRVLKLVDGGRVLGSEVFHINWMQRTFLRVRARIARDGHLMDQVMRTPWLEPLLHHGYAVVAVERPATGASFGSVHPSWEVAAREADQVLDWIAAQPWSNGRVGMFGDSYEAMTQYAAAASGNPHLKAILPCSSSFDFYSGLFYPGGIFNKGFGAPLPRLLALLEQMIVPVDGDDGATLLAQALASRRARTLGERASETLRRAPTRDARREGGARIWEETSLFALLERVNRSGVPVYNSNGWHDLFTRDVFLWHANLTVPQRLHVRPLSHPQMNESRDDLDFGAEAHRWFDYWLKGIDNGIVREPPVRYYLMGAPEAQAWRATSAWPPPDTRVRRLYLSAEGALAPQPPRTAQAHDRYRVDYSTTSGVDSRWNSLDARGGERDLSANDAKALVYTTPPLEADLEVTGHPVVSLWLRSDAPDLDLFVYLEDVQPDGRSLYVTEGSLRASHRARHEAPYANFGLPYGRSFAEDLAPLRPGEPAELVFDLQPTAQLFRRGHRLRIAITGADADNFETPRRDPPPLLELLRGADRPSFIELPARSPAAS